MKNTKNEKFKYIKSHEAHIYIPHFSPINANAVDIMEFKSLIST